MATNPSPASTSRPVEGAALSSEQTVMTEFVIAITAFCSLIFIFCVAFVFLFAYCKRIHREEDEDDGEYIGDEESLPESQQSYSQARKNIYGHPQGHPVGHKNHVLSVWDTYPLYHVREMHVAQKFWQAEAVRNPMHMGPAVIY